VRILDIWDDPERNADIEYMQCDIRDAQGVARAMQGIDVVHHNVALVPLTKSGRLFMRSMWMAARRIFAVAGLPAIVIRPRTILGGGRLGIFQILFDWIRDNSSVYVVGGGNNRLQFVHAGDLMDLYMLALDQEKPGVYNVGTDRFDTLRRELEGVVEYAGSTSRVKSLPRSLTIQTLRLLTGSVCHRWPLTTT
jgi:nucleoside-diphosphate-sugar epimerase